MNKKKLFIMTMSNNTTKNVTENQIRNMSQEEMQPE